MNRLQLLSGILIVTWLVGCNGVPGEGAANINVSPPDTIPVVAPVRGQDSLGGVGRIRDATSSAIRFQNSLEGISRFNMVSGTNYRLDPRSNDTNVATTLSPQVKAENGQEGDWNYNAGGSMNGAPALYGASFSVGSCSDRLIVPLNVSGTNNLFAFDNLYPTIPGGSGSCTNGGSDGGLCPSPYCPRRAWRVQLNGAMNRNSVALSEDGSHAYIATAAGRLYAINASDGSTAWTFNPGTDLDDLIVGAGSITFEGAVPWVDYSTCPQNSATGCTLYTAVWYKLLGSDRINVYRIVDNGSSRATLTSADKVTIGTIAVPEGTQTSPVLWGGYLYLGSTVAKLHKISVAATMAEVVTSPWPLQLWSSDTFPATNTDQPSILASVAIDATNNLLFVPVNNMIWSVNLSTNATSNATLSFGNSNANALNCNVGAYGTPWVDSATLNLFAGHGTCGLPNNGDVARRILRRTYTSAGVLASGATNVQNDLASNSGDLTYARSSPIMMTISGTNYIFAGDGGGNLNRFTFTTANGLNNRATFPTGSGVAIDSPVMVDYLSGFIYFGANNSRIYQITQLTLM